MLEKTYRTAKTPVNHNNDIGMPMAIMALPEDTEVAVLKMGMNHFREMAYLSSIGRPDIAVIVNIGTAHIEFLGQSGGDPSGQDGNRGGNAGERHPAAQRR